METTDNPEIIKVKNKQLYSTLSKTRMIIEDNINEIDIIKFRNRRDTFLDNVYRLGVNPTLDCNFKCWYCYESHPQGVMSKDIMNRIVKFIKNNVEKHIISGLNLSWFGGEPLLYFKEVVYPLSLQLKDIIESNNMTFQNNITTNGYLIDKDMLDMCDKIDLREFQITIDGNVFKY